MNNGIAISKGKGRKPWTKKEEFLIAYHIQNNGNASMNAIAVALHKEGFSHRTYNSILSKVRKISIKLGKWEDLSKEKKERRKNVINNILNE